METIKLTAESREQMGTRAARRCRAAGRLPVVIYGHGEPPATISLDRHDVVVALAHGARTLDVEMEGSTKQFFIKEVQRDHWDAEPIHLDLMRVALHERVKVRVGIELRGTPKGLSEGGVLDQLLAEIELQCLVTNIPETLHPLVTELGVGDSLLVRELELPAGVEVLADPEDKVATVRAVAEEVEAPVSLEGEEGAAEPERIGRVRKEEEQQG